LESVKVMFHYDYGWLVPRGVLTEADFEAQMLTCSDMVVPVNR